MEIVEIKSEKLNDKYYKIKHTSGLTIYVSPKEGYKSAYAIFGTHFGSVNSHFITNGEEVIVPDGIAHYLEHKLFESEDGDAFTKYAKTGANANAYTSFNTTCYLFSCTDKFDESLRILLDFVRDPYFTKETVAKEQGIIGQEIKMYDDSPDWRVMMNLISSMFQNHPVRKDIAGTVETIAEITPELLYTCYNSYYNLNNMVLSVAGNVTPEQVIAIVDEILTKQDEPLDTQSIFPDEPYEVGQDYVGQKLSVAVPLFQLGFKEDAGDKRLSSKEIAETDILLSAFAGEASPLYKRLLDDELINQSFGYEYFEEMGYRAVIFAAETRFPERVAEIIKQAAEELHKNGVPKEEFERAKRAIYGKNIAALNSPENTATIMASFDFAGRELYEYMDAIANASLDDINERLKSQLDSNNTTLSVVK